MQGLYRLPLHRPVAARTVAALARRTPSHPQPRPCKCPALVFAAAGTRSISVDSTSRERPIRAMSTNDDNTPAVQKPRLELKNVLDKSRSPYVRGHMNNPVAWQMWGPEALAMAKEHNRLLFVSIGYAACHWCHVMERESFENDQIADVLNDHFIPIKIDREERPDLDRVYMNYLQYSTGRGGWPLNVFLTPDLEPILGGTYFPGPDTDAVKAGAPGFLDVIKRVQMMWETQRERCLTSARSVTTLLKDFVLPNTERPAGEEDTAVDLELMEEAYQHFAQKFDSTYGGFGTAPKFPTPSNLSFLLTLGASHSEVKDVVGHEECEQAKQMVLSTLRSMTRGGINDQIGHGFARYSVTKDWSLPHFEKMLYDQPQLLSLYLDAFLLTGDPEMLGTVYSIASYLTSPPMLSPTGGFFSSEDADSLPTSSASEKREGAFYVWTLQEFIDVLGPKDAEILAKFYNVHETGNVDPEYDPHDELAGQNVLAISSTPDAISAKFNLSKEDSVKILKQGRAKLLKYRESQRPRPDLDDKIVAGWNGLAIGALSRTSSVLDSLDPPKAKECRDAAVKAVDFIRRELFDEKSGELKRVFRDGPGEAPAFADDYAFVVQGLLELYEATFDDSYLEFADRLQKTQTRLFHDEKNGGYFSTTNAQSDILLRLKDAHDNAEPSTNGTTASNLFRLSSFFGDEEYAKLAKSTVMAFDGEMVEHPFLFGTLLGSLAAARLGVREVTVTGEISGEGTPNIDVEQAVRILRSRLKPNTTVTRIGGGSKSDWLVKRNPLLAHMDPKKQVVQICDGGACREVQALSEVERAVTENI